MTKADQILKYSVDSQYGEIMPPKVESVDPVGSGDAFTGGTIAGLLSGLTSDQALTQGSICGASVASMFGDWTGIPTGKAGLINSDVLSMIRSSQ
jgi:2-dehydro-3-deoxygluconokinase